ncbi:Na(+) H(+) antiporter subunit A, partial [hydrothermal vent metagenome]
MEVAVGVILGAAIIAPFFISLTNRRASFLLALLPLAVTAYFVSLLPQIADGAVIQTRYAWVSDLGVELSFRLDGLSLLMALLICGIGTLVLLYASEYLAGHEQIGRFYALILLFMGAMLGLVLADNLLLLFVFWELTSISSYLLIGFKHEQEKARKSALQALLVTGSGGLLLLVGLILLAQAGGSWELSTLLAQSGTVQNEPLYGVILLLVLLGAFTKSAQFPFHFWLPNAMAAPTPVSAYLHSATMVKAGIYLLARLFPVLGGTVAWSVVLVSVGGITAVIGAWLSWQKTDMKQILAYSTISALGLLVLLLGVGTDLALKTAILFLLTHALYKGALFMAAGTIEHESGTRDISQLGGLARKMPLTLIGVLVAALSMAGLPPLLGFLSKEYLYDTTLNLPLVGNGLTPVLTAVLTATVLLTNIFLVLASAVIIMKPFFGNRSAASKQAHEAPFSMWLGPIVLGVLTLLLGSVPNLVAATLLAPATTAVAGKSIKVSLSLWYGFTPMLALSMVTVAAGAGGYLLYGRLHSKAVRLDTAVSRIGPARWYQFSLDSLLRLAAWQTRQLQNGYLHHYMKLVLLSLLLLVGGTAIVKGAFDWPKTLTTPHIHEVGLAGVILAATIMAVTTRSRLAAIAALGTIGYSIAMFYVLFSAPDVAMTQFAIETLTVVLFVLVLYRLPYFNQFTNKLTRQRDALIALASGALMTALVLTVTAMPAERRLTPFFAENSLTLAK